MPLLSKASNGGHLVYLRLLVKRPAVVSFGDERGKAWTTVMARVSPRRHLGLLGLGRRTRRGQELTRGEGQAAWWTARSWRE